MKKVKLNGLGQGSGSVVEILDRKEIEKAIEELSSREIIEAAYKGYVKGFKNGYAVIELRTGELNTNSLSDNESNQAIDCVYIILYKVGQNDEFCACDILSEEEIAEGKEVEYEDIIDYLDFHFELDWNYINEQLSDWYEV